MTVRLAEKMVRRCYLKMIAETDYGLAWHWWMRLHEYARRRDALRMLEGTP